VLATQFPQSLSFSPFIGHNFYYDNSKALVNRKHEATFYQKVDVLNFASAINSSGGVFMALRY